MASVGAEVFETERLFRQRALERMCRELLVEIGEDPDREGLQETPRRWAAWWREFIDHLPGDLNTCFTSTSEEMVVVQGIEVWSLCEHHLLPFRATVSMGYMPAKKVLGLSKFARIAHARAHRLQLQERLTAEIADTLSDLTDTEDVAVLADGYHLCMAMRGVRTPATMRTSVMRGRFRENVHTREEFLKLAC